VTTPQAPAPLPRRVRVPAGSLHVLDYPGEAPAVVAMHGFPDDSRIYHRQVPHLCPRRVVTFDWLGFGHSDRRPAGSGFNPRDRQGELLAVLDTLKIPDAVLVGHDASGPEAINFALEHSDRVTALVLLNTYYGRDQSLHFPEMIALMGDPEYRQLVDAIMADEAQRLWLLGYTAQRFGGHFGDPDGLGAVSVLPQFFGARDNPIALEEIRAWTAHLPSALDTQDQAVTAGKLRHLEMPAIVAFGADDPYLTPALGRHVAGLFTNPTVHDIPHASHWPQWDQPQAVAHLINNTLG